MKKLATFLIIVIALLTLLFCINASDQSTSESKIIRVEIENCKTSVDLKLSDLVDSCWLIPLDTTKESMLGAYIHYVYISDTYIIIVDLNGIYKFSENGDFIKKM